MHPLGHTPLADDAKLTMCDARQPTIGKEIDGGIWIAHARRQRQWRLPIEQELVARYAAGILEIHAVLGTLSYVAESIAHEKGCSRVDGDRHAMLRSHDEGWGSSRYGERAAEKSSTQYACPDRCRLHRAASARLGGDTWFAQSG